MQVRHLDQKEGSTHPAFTGEGWCRGQGGWALYGAQVAGDMGWSSDPIVCCEADEGRDYQSWVHLRSSQVRRVGQNIIQYSTIPYNTSRGA